MVSKLFCLPLELIEAILLSDLSLSDLAAVRLQNRHLHSIVDLILRIIYRNATKTAGVVDNPLSPAPILERLSRVRRRESAWASFQLDNGLQIPEDDIPIHFDNDGTTVGVAEGYLLLQDVFGRTLWFSRVPALDELWMEDFTLEWLERSYPPLAPHTEECHTERLAIKLDGDLLAVVGVDGVDQERQVDVWLHILNFPSMQPHISAPLPSIQLCQLGIGTSRDVQVTLQVTGDNIGVFINSPKGWYNDGFFIVNWKLGIVIASKVASPKTYGSFAFLSESAVVLVNRQNHTLDLCHIPAATSSHRPLELTAALSLGLPALQANIRISGMQCDTSPLSCRKGLPAADGMHSNYPPPFETSWSDAIIAFGVLYANVTDYFFYRLVTHRRSLLQLLLASSSHVLVPGIQARVDWSAWGPSRARWLDVSQNRDSITNVTYGQRLLYFNADFTDMSEDHDSIQVFDFNFENVQASSNAVTSDEFVEVHKSKMMVFAETLRSALPYVVSTSLEEYAGYGAWMDEERIFVIEGTDNRVTHIKVLHMG